MDQATIDKLKTQGEAIRGLLNGEPAAIDRERLLAMAEAIDAKLQEASRRKDAATPAD